MPMVWLHLLFWAPYIARGMVDRRRGASQDGPAAHVAPGARALIALHCVAFIVLYGGLGQAIAANAGPAVPGVAFVLALGGFGLSCWTLWIFRSWRLRAELTATHELTTDGPFRYVRNPIYVAVNLVAFATLAWAPNPAVALGTALSVLAGDLRARAEERLLLAAFGQRYTDYARRVRRFVPGIY